jgi:hypothetical protein
MNEADKNHFKENGFVFLRNLFAPAEIDECVDEMLTAFNHMSVARGLPPAPSRDMAGLSQVMKALFAADMQAYLATAKLVQHMAPFHRMGATEALTRALKALGLDLPIISTRPFLFIVSDAIKVPGGYHKSPAHQDFRSIQGSLDGVVVWAPFASIKPGEYALEIVPGSHKRGLLPSKDHPFGHEVLVDIPESDFTPITINKGDVLVMSVFLVHRTGVKGGGQVRIAGSFRFNNAAEPSFIARSYPNPYIYRPDLTLLDEGVATSEQVAKVFAA